MSTRLNWTHLDPLTKSDLKRNRTVDLSITCRETTARYACGCMTASEGVIWLCDYHEGFEDGIEEARRKMKEPKKGVRGMGARLRKAAYDLYEEIPEEGRTPDWDQIEPLLDRLFALADEIDKEDR